MANKTKGGLGKTARSSALAREQAQAREALTRHICALCKLVIKVKEYLPVLVLPGRKRVDYHRGCYEKACTIPAGSVGKNDPAKGKKR